MPLEQTSFPFDDGEPKPPPGQPDAVHPAPRPPLKAGESASLFPEEQPVRATTGPANADLGPAGDATSDAGPGDPAPAQEKKSVKSTRGRKSVKELAAQADLIEIPADDVLFQKQYYGIGEVATMFNVNTSLIRYWETEFSEIHPRKNKKGDRYFTPEDVRTIELIHFLLRQKKLTIEGAKEYLTVHARDGGAKLEMIRSLENIKAFLLKLRASI